MISYAFNKGGVNRLQNVLANGEKIQIEVYAPMTSEEINKHIKRLQTKCPIYYREIKKEKYNSHQFYLKYTKDNIFNEPFKMIPLISKKGMKVAESYGVIEVPIPPIRIIKS